jgi:hypothetical protein
MKRRSFVLSTAAGLTALAHAQPPGVPDAIQKLRPMTDGVKPITREERSQRLEKARSLMRANRLSAIFVGPGSTMFYFTGMRWRGSEASLGLLIPAHGETGLDRCRER